MKLSTVFSLCVIAPTVSAFFVKAPKTAVSPSFSYLGNLESSNTGSNLYSDMSRTETATQQQSGYNPAMARQVPDRAGSSIAPKGQYGTQREAKDKNIWDTLSPVTVQGGSLRTWSFATPAIDRVQVLLKSEGRPLHANVELWQGPDNTPQKMVIYNEDGSLRPFSAVLETPGGQNAIAIKNTGQMEFPLGACVEAEIGETTGGGLGAITQNLARIGTPKTVQGGAVHTYPFDPTVASVQVMLKTDGRPLNARLELMQGPNNNKQVIDLYCEDGNERPFFAVIETPGSGNVVRIINTATLEFPMSAIVEAYQYEEYANRGGEGGEHFILS